MFEEGSGSVVLPCEGGRRHDARDHERADHRGCGHKGALSVRHAPLAVVKASRCEATKSRTVIGGFPVSSAMILSSPEKMPF